MSLAIAYTVLLAKIAFTIAGLLLFCGLVCFAYFFGMDAWDQIRDGEHLDRAGWMMLGALIGVGLLVGDLVFGRVALWMLG